MSYRWCIMESVLYRYVVYVPTHIIVYYIGITILRDRRCGNSFRPEWPRDLRYSRGTAWISFSNIIGLKRNKLNGKKKNLPNTISSPCGVDIVDGAFGLIKIDRDHCTYHDREYDRVYYMIRVYCVCTPVVLIID